MSSDRFEATLVVQTNRAMTWDRLTEHTVDSTDESRRLWLPGFDASVTIVSTEKASELCVTKDDEPCAGTNIVVKLVDADTGTQITVVQSGFGDWMPPRYDVMAVGWHHIIADLATYLDTGVHARRHLRAWGDFGADVDTGPGGLRVSNVRPDTLAERLSLRDGDLLVMLADAPVSTHNDLETVLRVLSNQSNRVTAEVVRGDALVLTTIN